MKIVFAIMLIVSAVFGMNGTYKSSKYPFCSSSQYLDDWTGFTTAGDKDSMRAYFGTKCFQLTEDIKVSNIKLNWGKATFFYKGYKLHGYREGVQ